MALRKLAGPFLFKDLYGNPAHQYTFIGPWADELDGFLTSTGWLHSFNGGSTAGYGITQLDGVVTPRASFNGTVPIAAPYPPYDPVTRKWASVTTVYSAGTASYTMTVKKGIDWFTLALPLDPETQVLEYAADGVHAFHTSRFALLPDRVLFIGEVITSPFYFGPPTLKLFSVPFVGASAATPPVFEADLQTSKVPGSEDWEDWGDSIFIQSATPERTVILLWKSGNGPDNRAMEYDYINKKFIGWVRRLGDQPELGSAPLSHRLAGFCAKHRLWAVEDSTEDSRRRISFFADEAVPAHLSNPVALSPSVAGEAVRYRVRLTGADYEPCIGHRVSWTCSALGNVLVTQSLTDDNGYAETLVAYPPRYEGPWEGTTITAEVTF